MRSKISRRKFLATIGAAAGISSLARPALAQQKPVKIGLMTVKTGGLAAGGVHLEEGITCLLRDKNFTLAGRQIELVVADTAGVPATAKAKAIELVERDKVDLIMGPLAAFEWLAIKDYLGEHKVPTMGFGGAEDLTQRHRVRSARALLLNSSRNFATKSSRFRFVFNCLRNTRARHRLRLVAGISGIAPHHGDRCDVPDKGSICSIEPIDLQELFCAAFQDFPDRHC
jgi:Periplasmic binding protein